MGNLLYPDFRRASTGLGRDGERRSPETRLKHGDRVRFWTGDSLAEGTIKSLGTDGALISTHAGERLVPLNRIFGAVAPEPVA